MDLYAIYYGQIQLNKTNVDMSLLLEVLDIAGDRMQHKNSIIETI